MHVPHCHSPRTVNVTSASFYTFTKVLGDHRLSFSLHVLQSAGSVVMFAHFSTSSASKESSV